jgi:transcriptional regulator with XRE-family HTH domain
MSEKLSPVGNLLFEHFMIYQNKVRRVITQKEFADLVGVDDKVYNNIYHGRQKASKTVINRLAEYFDDLRFYDAAGMDRPDPLLFSVQRNWEKIPNAVRKKISETIAPYIAEDDE